MTDHANGEGDSGYRRDRQMVVEMVVEIVLESKNPFGTRPDRHGIADIEPPNPGSKFSIRRQFNKHFQKLLIRCGRNRISPFYAFSAQSTVLSRLKIEDAVLRHQFNYHQIISDVPAFHPCFPGQASELSFPRINSGFNLWKDVLGVISNLYVGRLKIY